MVIFLAIEHGPVEIVDLPSYKMVIFLAIEHGPVEIVDLPVKNGDFLRY